MMYWIDAYNKAVEIRDFILDMGLGEELPADIQNSIDDLCFVLGREAVRQEVEAEAASGKNKE